MKQKQGSAHMAPIADPGTEKHDDGSAGVAWCSESLRQGGIEAHGVAQDDGQEECERVSLRGESTVSL